MLHSHGNSKIYSFVFSKWHPQWYWTILGQVDSHHLLTPLSQDPDLYDIYLHVKYIETVPLQSTLQLWNQLCQLRSCFWTAVEKSRLKIFSYLSLSVSMVSSILCWYYLGQYKRKYSALSSCPQLQAATSPGQSDVCICWAFCFTTSSWLII